MQGANDGMARALHLASVLLAIVATAVSLWGAGPGVAETTLPVVIGLIAITWVLLVSSKVLYWWPRVSIRRSVIVIHEDPIASDLEVVRRPGGGRSE